MSRLFSGRISHRLQCPGVVLEIPVFGAGAVSAPGFCDLLERGFPWETFVYLGSLLDDKREDGW